MKSVVLIPLLLVMFVGSAMATRMSSAQASWYGPGLYGNHTACGQILTTSDVRSCSQITALRDESDYLLHQMRNCDGHRQRAVRVRKGLRSDVSCQERDRDGRRRNHPVSHQPIDD